MGSTLGLMNMLCPKVSFFSIGSGSMMVFDIAGAGIFLPQTVQDDKNNRRNAPWEKM